jgi:hypothetical protein
MFFNLQSTFKLGSLCLLLIVMMVSSTTSYINTVSYAEDNTTPKLTSSSSSSSLPSRNVLVSSDNNSTLDEVSEVQDIQSKLLAKDLEDILQSAVSALELGIGKDRLLTR